jgi:aspartyl-tRNA(Asn)/glutamyl-tRNA(Gln) amidotransferase subunit A
MVPDSPTPQDVLTAAEAARHLRAGHVSAVALVQECLARIATVDPTIRACVTVMGEAALAQAEAADEQLRGGRDRRPLLGIPLGIKDLIATQGVRTTAGSRVLDDWVPDHDATVVTRLAAAGGIALCKTNTHEFAFGTVTPPTRNPWDPERIPGGSSGGSAAAVAAGECLAALGTDTGGSIRIPAAACGVSGLKPTFGLVSRSGVVPLSWSLDHAGPIARSVEDCALLLDVLAGYDPTDPDSVDVPLLNYNAALLATRTPEDAVRGTVLGLPTSYFFRHLDPEVERAVQAAIETLVALGATVREVALPPNLDDLFGVYRTIQRPEAYTYHEEMGWLRTRADRYDPVVRENILAGAGYSASDYIRAQRTRHDFTTQMRTRLREVDALVTPTLPVPARRISELDTPVLWDGQPEPAGEALRLTFPFDLTGQPALTVPCGFTTSGLPIGLQLIAGHFGEATLLRLGHAYQRVTDWHLRLPPLVAAAMAEPRS